MLKLKLRSLHIRPLGVAIVFEDDTYGKLSEYKKAVVALAGPITNVVAILIISLLKIDWNLKNELINVNFLIAVFNLIPIYPLDGGRILKFAIRMKFDENKTDRVINKISNIMVILLTAISSILILYIKNLSILLIIIYLWVIVIRENRQYKLKKRIGEIIKKDERDLTLKQ